MSDSEFLENVYKVRSPDEVRAYYDQWAKGYDAEVSGNGYATPARCAAALVTVGTPKDARILDFGCGTGISGEALATAGFTRVDGCDLSAEMLAEARAKGVYGDLNVIEAGASLPKGYDVIAAVGVIGAGAAPPEAFGTCLDALAPGGRFVFSFNDHTLADERFPPLVEAAKAAGAKVIFEEYGPHLTGLGMQSMVYVLEV